MTEISPQIQHAEHSLAFSLPASIETPAINGFAAPVAAPVEDDSTIRCICGYSDDDGLTVLCEECNTWQHIDCYYPNYPSEGVPEVHQCINCHPRPIDASAAADRQSQSRVAAPTAERKPKKAPTKSHKKRVKDSSTPAHINGVSTNDRFGHDRTSGSPHEPPPAKRPKTSHRASASINSIVNPPNSQVNAARRRTNSIAVARASPTKSPSSPNGLPSPEERYSSYFMHLYDKEWQNIETNSFSTIKTMNALSSWLNDSDQFEQVANGKSQHEVYSRWDKPMDELRQLSPGVRENRFEDTSVLAHGRHPVYYNLTVEQEAAQGSFLGELNGQITTKKDYEDSSILFSTLRHPEPFVFYSDKLPICIDARNEGSNFRYIRRSCTPTARMQIIIVGQEYRFCLVSNQPLLADEEITISWYIDPRVIDISRRLTEEKRTVTPEDIEYRARWVAGVLAHFGECACNRPKDQCIFNLAGIPRLLGTEHNGHHIKISKKKPRRGPQISPLSTGRATNSRAGSEAVNHLDIDEDAIDSRSVTGSIRSKPSSRDNTPSANTAESSIGLGVELSSREQRKIQEQERLFAQMEQDGTKKKKRNSAGSALNTPSVSASKQLSHLEPFDPSPTSATGSSKVRINGRSSSEQKIRVTSASRSISTKLSDPNNKKSYSETSTQTEQASEEPMEPEVEPHIVNLRRATGCTFAQKLLGRSKKMRARADRRQSEMSTPTSSKTSTPAATPEIKQDVHKMPPPPLPAHLSRQTNQELTSPDISSMSLNPTPSEEDTDMIEAPSDSADLVAEPEAISPSPDSAMRQAKRQKTQSLNDSEPDVPVKINDTAPLTKSPSPEKENKPPVETMEQTEIIKSQSPTKSSSKPNLTIETPAPPNFNAEISQTPTTPSVSSAGHPPATSPTSAGAAPPDTPSIIQSPTAVKSLSSAQAALASPVASTPQRKKMSLSDWTNRLKKKKIIEAQQAAQASPLSSTMSVTSADYLAAKNSSDSAIVDMPELTPVEPSAMALIQNQEELRDDIDGEVKMEDVSTGKDSTDEPTTESTAMDVDPPEAAAAATNGS